jgi:NhaP-type Na+/H+ or K+/H+ antiporter
MNFIIFIIVVFALAYGAGILFNKIKLPKLLGYLVVGLIIGNFFNFNYLITDQVVRIVTTFALSIILLKAGLGIEKAIIRKIGIRVLLLGTIPNIIEALVLTAISYYLLSFGIYEAFMFGFIISAVSPAVVIPSMTKLMDEGYDKHVTTLNLAATSFDDVVSLTMFSVFLALYLGDSGSISLLLLAPINIILGAIVGGIIGFGLGKLLKHTSSVKWQIAQFIGVITIALLLKQYGHYLFIIEMIAIMTLGYYLNDSNKEVGIYIKKYTNTVWTYAQVFLFFTIGFLADLSIIGDYLIIGIGIIMLGLLGRTIGVLIALHKSDFTNNQKAFSVIGNMPKATVQAVLGAVPLSYGVMNGDIILSLSALAIIVTAPIGLLLIEIYSVKLLKREPLKAN